MVSEGRGHQFGFTAYDNIKTIYYYSRHETISALLSIQLDGILFTHH